MKPIVEVWRTNLGHGWYVYCRACVRGTYTARRTEAARLGRSHAVRHLQGFLAVQTVRRAV